MGPSRPHRLYVSGIGPKPAALGVREQHIRVGKVKPYVGRLYGAGGLPRTVYGGEVFRPIWIGKGALPISGR